MSASRNPDSLVDSSTGGSGEFNSRVERSEPLTTTGHQPGKLVGNEAAPEFHAQTLPPGSAPADRTFSPNVSDEAAPTQQGSDDVDPEAPRTKASDTITGATSASVHTGLGHPGSGQSSAELHHDGQSHRKNPGQGGVDGRNTVYQSGINPHLPEHAGQRALDNDDAVIGRGNVGGAAAEDRVPQSAESVASERP